MFVGLTLQPTCCTSLLKNYTFLLWAGDVSPRPHNSKRFSTSFPHQKLKVFYSEENKTQSETQMNRAFFALGWWQIPQPTCSKKKVYQIQIWNFPSSKKKRKTKKFRLNESAPFPNLGEKIRVTTPPILALYRVLHKYITNIVLYYSSTPCREQRRLL